MEFIKYVPTPMFGNNLNFTEMSVVTLEPFLAKTTIEGLVGYTATVEKGTLSSDMEFSVFAKNARQERIMLGPASFVNHSCKPNSR